MFTYINLCKPNKTKLNLDDLKFNFEYNCWKNNVRPIIVINENIKFLIDYNILDGVHHYVKHINLKNKYLTNYINLIFLNNCL